ncbi:AraC family transcriptional regulator [Novosphingobium album (ex Liu et al. 2023)]|uniref:AraC family transcriptional regulator n=1 Tax=Novosphingobium album (ex Liu et al. 2023) TaxID=3031130 RepID=A0ABT5WVR4_9SPHN|nr:AraC family transcriptional regulator [Novosphingobium album (ex Liu et al. 2023)]MDE8653994.1 AraC family transcriptional regulator [Novosphingobium album (ex Liu et al. 2023)]
MAAKSAGQEPAGPGGRPVSEIVAGIRLSGRTWCYADFAGAAGFAVAPADGVFFHAVIHGAVRVACTGGARAELGPGDAVFVLSGEAHALRTAPGAPAQPHACLRAGDEADIPPTWVFGEGGRIGARVLSARLGIAWPGEIGRGALPALLPVASAAAPLLRPDAIAAAGIGPGACALLTRLAELLLIAALRADPAARAFLSPRPRDPIGEAVRMIAAHPAADWTVGTLAHAVGMGRSNFAAHFTREIGRAPMEVVAEHRMEQAAIMLRQGRLKIAEIGEMAGYGSEAAFSRRFTRHFGVTPSQMRETARAARVPAPVPAPAFRPLLSGEPARDMAAFARARAATEPAPREDDDDGGTSRAAPPPPRRSFLFPGRRD